MKQCQCHCNVLRFQSRSVRSSIYDPTKQTKKRNGPLNARGVSSRPRKETDAERERYHADPEMKRSSAKRESYQAEPEKKQTAERERYQVDPKKLNANVIKQTQKRNGPLKGNVIGRVLNVLAWRRECGTGRLSVVPCQTNEAIEKVLPTKLFKGM